MYEMKMYVLKLFCRCPANILGNHLSKLHSCGSILTKKFSDKKCNEIRGKHQLVPCKENDTVPLSIEEPIQITPNVKVPCKENYHRVIIIGAGIAGLSAAARMVSCNMNEFIVLEARDRPGGRVETRKLGSTNIELGAEFIEGASIANPIYQLACIHGLITDQSPRIDHRGGIFLLSDSRAIEGSEKVLKDLKLVLEDLPSAAQREDEADYSLFDHVEVKMKERIESYPGWERDDAMRMVYSIMNDLRGHYGIDPTDVSVKNYGTRVELPGGRMRIDDGTIGVVKALLNSIPKEKVICNKGVQTIWWCEGTDGCRVRCFDGTEYRACHVIITVSLAVLRSQNNLFCPPLPPDKIEAIQGIPFGKAAKVFLRYEAPFWLDRNLTLRFGWLKEELGDRQDWVKGIGSIEYLPSKTDNILRMTVGGRESQRVERNGDAAMELLNWIRSSIGSLLPLPLEMTISCWNCDLFIGGSWSFSAPRWQKILAEPLPYKGECSTLLFAGEATVPGYIGSMHSAAISGVREADNLLKFIKAFTDEMERIDKEYEKTVAEHEKKMEEAHLCKKEEHEVSCPS